MSAVLAQSRRGLAGLGLALLAGCGGSPEPAFYTLAAVPGAARPVVGSLELRRVALAGYLDRAAIVRASVGFRLEVATNERWGEPLDRLIGRILAENLAQRLSGATLVQEGAATSLDTDLVVEVDVQRLDADVAGRVLLLAQIAVRPRRGGGAGNVRTHRSEIVPPGPGTPGFAAAVSAAVGELADAIAAAVPRAAG